MVYHSHRQFAGNRNWALTQVVAFDRPMPPRLDEMRRELASIDPALVLDRPRMLTDVIGLGIAQERFALLLVGSFAGLALALAAVGIYGVLAYLVSQRTHEIGIRLAVGADRAQVLGMVLRQGLSLAAAGIVVGLIGAFALTRLMRGLLYQVGPNDPTTFAAVTAALLLVALLASFLPARRATRVSPVIALRAR
jgi:ABC-type antimicrobial peptide transport system permease subunit